MTPAGHVGWGGQTMNFIGSTGDDIFTGGGQTDTATGGDGADTLSGGDGNDILSGNAGGDLLVGDEGDDRLSSGDLTLNFYLLSSGDHILPVLDTGTAVDTLVGGGGSDLLFAGYGDNVDGGGGATDHLYISFLGASSGVTADFRQTTLVIGGGTITGVENISWVQGSNFDDDIVIGDMFNPGYYALHGAVFGMGGNDRLVAGYNSTVLDGGDGADTVDGRNSQYLMIVSGGAGDDVLYTNVNTTSRADGGDGDDVIYSHSRTNGGNGDDLIVLQFTYYGGFVSGDAGDDEIRGTLDNNSMAGGAGADLLLGDEGADWLGSGDFAATNSGLAGDDMGLEQDSLSGGLGDDMLAIGYGDNVDGGGGLDKLSLSLGGLSSGTSFNTAGITAGPFVLGGGTIQNVERLDALRGTEFADTLTAATQSTLLTINAGAGNDVVYSSNSSVDLRGGDGDDSFVSGAAGDLFDGGQGRDAIVYSGAAAGVTVNLATGTGPGGDQLVNVETVIASAHNDTVTGGDEANELYGAQGNDCLTGGGGDDLLDGDLGIDCLTGGAGDDRLYGGLGNDGLIGDVGDDRLDGGQGADTAVFTGARADVWVRSFFDNGVINTEVLDVVGYDGRDTLTGVESLSFGGTAFGLAGIQQNHLASLNGERFDDVLIRNASTGQIAFVDMTGQAAGTQGVVRAVTSALPAGWTAAASGDLDGDGRAEAIVQSPTGGLFYINTASGSPVWGAISANLPSEWQVVGLGDMTLDGTLDIVIRNSVSGNIMYAEMDRTTFGGWGNVFNMGTGWRAAGLGDYDRDGDSDVLVQETATGTTYFVQMQNGAFAGWGLVTGGPGSQWVAKEAADLNGDGYFDVVFQNSVGGQIWYVNMAGGVNSGWGTLVTAADWAVVGSGDYDNDGYADILVQGARSGGFFYIDVDNGLMTGWGNVKNGLGTDWVAV